MKTYKLSVHEVERIKESISSFMDHVPMAENVQFIQDNLRPIRFLERSTGLHLYYKMKSYKFD